MQKEGAGNAGCSDSTRSLGCESEEARNIVTTGSPKHAGIPCTMVYGLLRALLGDRACLPPSLTNVIRKLDASVGATSARFPKFVHRCGPSFHELRTAKGTSKFKIFQCRFRFEVPVADSRQPRLELQIGDTGTTRLRRPKEGAFVSRTSRVRRLLRGA
jgi:hypothetical protein